MRPLCIALPLLFVVACADAPDTGPAFTARDSAGVTIAENVMTAVTASCTLDSTPVLRIGGADDSDAQTLYRVMGGSRLSDGRIALVNQGTQEVRWYDSTGALVGRAGREGRGPGEFQDAFLMYRTAGDTLWVGDYRPWQWHLFGPDMKFVRTVVTSPPEINSPDISAILDDGQQIFGNSAIGERASWAMDSVTITRYAPDGTLRDTVMAVPTGRRGQIGDASSVWMRPWFEGHAVVEGSGDRLAVATWNEAELVIYTVADRVTPWRIIRWTTEDRSIPASAVEAARAEFAGKYPDLSPDMKARMVDPMLDPKRPVADRYPAVTRIVMGTDGRIWVRGYAPADAPTRPWTAFSSEGRALCRAAFPALEVYEIGRDYLLAHESDSLGVERVVLYRLSAE
jgi:hypothetical protein